MEGKVIIELKSVEKVNPAHKKQLLTYLRLTGIKLGYVLNFSDALMKDGITRTHECPVISSTVIVGYESMVLNSGLQLL